MFQPECSKMKAKCLQIFALAALTPVKMQTTRGKNLAKSLTEQRKKLWQESGKQETSFHLCRCQNELRQLSWGNTERVGKRTACTTPDEHMLEGGAKGRSPGSLPTSHPRRRHLTKPQAPSFVLFSDWVGCKTSKGLSSLWLGSLLWKLYQKISPRIIQVDGNYF